MSADLQKSGPLGRLLLGWAAIVFVGWILVIWLWPPVIYCMTADDSYYYLVTARNASHGFGFTFDQINPTNGFHPLWEYLLVPLARILGADMELFVRSVLTIQLGLIFLGAEILGRALQDRKRLVLVSTATLMVNFYFTKTLVNGLESALQWLLICFTLARMLRLLERGVEKTSNWQFFGLGILAGLTILARLTAVWFAGAVVLMVLLDFGEHGLKSSLPAIFKRSTAIVLGTCLIVVPYLADNYVTTGHFETVSAAIKVSRASAFRPLVAVAIVGYALVGLAVAIAVWKSRDFLPATRRFVRALFPVIVYFVLQGEADAIVRRVLKPEIWSLVPLSLIAAILLAHLFAAALSAQRAALRRPLAMAAALGLAGFAAFTWQYILNPQSYRWYLQVRAMAEWIRQNTDESSVIGSFDAGIVGGYSQRRTVNLDGLINSWDYKKYMDEGKTQEWITSVCPVDYLAIAFVDDQFNSATLSDYCWSPTGAKDPGRIRIDLSKWTVAYLDRSPAGSWMQTGLHDYFFLVLTRKAEGTPLAKFLEELGKS